MATKLQEEVAGDLTPGVRAMTEACETLAGSEPLSAQHYAAMVQVIQTQKNMICDLTAALVKVAGRV